MTGQQNRAEIKGQCGAPAHIRIGTRGSALALAQTDLFIRHLQEIYPQTTCEKVIIRTTGDKISDKPLAEFGGKAVFVSEFEDAIRNGTIDYAVHSAKDMPMELAEGLDVVCVLPRADARDVLVTRRDAPLSMTGRAVIGTGSLRRQSQIAALYENVRCESMRGNVTTRIRKLKDGVCDGIVLAAAGLWRLGLDHDGELSYHYLDVEEMIPAGGQGIIAVEGKADGWDYLRAVTDERAALALCVERDILKRLDAGCHEAVGVYAEVSEKEDEAAEGSAQTSGAREAAEEPAQMPDAGGTAEESAQAPDEGATVNLMPDAQICIRIFREQDGVLCRQKGSTDASNWQALAEELVAKLGGGAPEG